MHSGVWAPTGRLRDANDEARGQKLVDIEAKDQRSEGQRGLESKLIALRPLRSGLELEDK